MGQRSRTLGIVVLLMVVIAAIDFAVVSDVSGGLLYFIPVGLCAWYFGHGVTLSVATVAAVLYSLFAANVCPHQVVGAHYTLPHLCYGYIVGSALRLILYGLWGMVIRLVRQQRESIERLGWESLTDSLTGLFNRRYLQAKLREEKARADRYKRPFSIIMADIDHFKAYNDEHGHHKGDELLKKIASIFRKSVREIDVVCRYGGEEFLILLPETDTKQAQVVAERLRSLVAARTAGDLDSAAPVTISMGIATYPHHATSPEMTILEADSALYQAKNTGRNRICTPPEKAKPGE